MGQRYGFCRYSELMSVKKKRVHRRSEHPCYIEKCSIRYWLLDFFSLLGLSGRSV